MTTCRPSNASVAALVTIALVGAGLATAALAAGPEETALAAFLQDYDRAFATRDVSKLAAFYHPDLTVFEGGHVNTGWADYRDHHLGPELAEMEGAQLTHSKVAAHVLPGGAAYVTSEYRLQAKVGGKAIDAEGLETLVIVKGADGGWKVRHVHSSSRRKPTASNP